MRNPSFSALTVAPAAKSCPGFLLDVLSGLGRLNKAIPPRWFYDQEGSKLFEDITRLPQYYPTRCERTILSTYIREIVETKDFGYEQQRNEQKYKLDSIGFNATWQAIDRQRLQT